MIPLIYFIILIGWGLVLVGFLMQEFTVRALGAILLIVTGIYVSINGIIPITPFVNNELVSLALSIINTCVGTYILIRGIIITEARLKPYLEQKKLTNENGKEIL